MDTISAIRNIKINLGISAKKKIDIYCRGEKIKTDAFKINKAHLEYLLNVQNIFTGTDIEKPEKSATCVINNIEIFLPLKGLIDINKELSRLEFKMHELDGRIKNVNKKLSNDNFIKRAPGNIVAHEKEKYNNYINDYNKIKENYDSLKSD